MVDVFHEKKEKDFMISRKIEQEFSFYTLALFPFVNTCIKISYLHHCDGHCWFLTQKYPLHSFLLAELFTLGGSR